MKNRSLQALFLYNGIFVFAIGLLGPLYAVFVETINTNVLSISISWAAFLLSSALGILILRRSANNIKRKERLLLTNFLIRSIVWFFMPFISTVLALIISQIVLGMGEAIGSSAYDAMFTKHLDPGKHSKAYTNWKLITNITGAAAVMTGGFMVKYAGFAALFNIMGFLALISFFGILVQPKRSI